MEISFFFKEKIPPQWPVIYFILFKSLFHRQTDASFLKFSSPQKQRNSYLSDAIACFYWQGRTSAVMFQNISIFQNIVKIILFEDPYQFLRIKEIN